MSRLLKFGALTGLAGLLAFSYISNENSFSTSKNQQQEIAKLILSHQNRKKVVVTLGSPTPGESSRFLGYHYSLESIDNLTLGSNKKFQLSSLKYFDNKGDGFGDNDILIYALETNSDHHGVHVGPINEEIGKKSYTYNSTPLSLEELDQTRAVVIDILKSN
jgi:hypothetical protein